MCIRDRFTASVITLFLFIIYDENTKLSVLAPTLVVFLAAAYRLIPSFSTILSSLQGFQYNIQSLNNLLIDSVKFKKIDNQKQSQIKFQKIINLKNVSFTYNNLNDDIDRNDILKEINLEIHQGEKIGIVGESGSGKSTLLDVLMGLLSPTEGLIKVDDTNIKSNETGWQKNIGCVPQDVFVIDDSLKKNIAFGLDEDLIEDKKIEKAINQANLEKFVQSLEEGVETKIGERGERVSGGQKQRVGIARALYFEPEVLILDEPTSALDKKTQKKIVEEIFLNNSKKTIIFVSHDKNNLIKCDKIYKLENKKLSLL